MNSSSSRTFWGVVLLALAGAGVWISYSGILDPPPTPAPVDPAPPVPPPAPSPKPHPKPRPWVPPSLLSVGETQLGGPVWQGLEVQCDLPTSLRKKNIGGTDGAGLCVFTSIMHGARYQNERPLWNFQEQMSHERGGGWPKKVDAMMEKYASSTHYYQYEGGDLTTLDHVISTGRMPCVTYNGHDPHYGPISIAHMVNLVYLDDRYAAILDNNFIKDNDLVWMTREDFRQRWSAFGGGWSVILAAPAPAPIPIP